MPDWSADAPAQPRPAPPAPRPSRRRPGVILAASGAALVVGIALAVVAVLVLRAERDDEPPPIIDPLTGERSAGRNGVENGTADEIWHAAQAAVHQANSVRVTGNTLLELPDVDRWRMDLSFTRQGDAKGVYRNEEGDAFELRRVAGRLYVRGAWLFRTWGPEAAERVGDRWVRVPPEVLREVGDVEPTGGGLGLADSPEAQIRDVLTWSFNNFLGLDAMADDVGGLVGRDPEHPQPLRKRPGIAVVDGRPAAAIEQGGFYLLVAASGPPYPLEYSPTPGGGTTSGDWHFGAWNAPVEVAAPPGAVDLVDVKL